MSVSYYIYFIFDKGGIKLSKRGGLAYGGISTLSAFIRQYYLPNPFGTYFVVDRYGLSPAILALLSNIFIGGLILHIAAFCITGCIYERGSNPALGSTLYLLFYVISVGVLFLLCSLGNSFNLKFEYLLLFFLFATFLISSIIRKISNHDFTM